MKSRMHVVLSGSFLAVSAACLWFVQTGNTADEKKQAERVFELRTYTTNEGKLDDLHNRFRDHTNKLFEKHGMQLIAYWTPTDKARSKDTLIYVLAHKSRDAAKKSWGGFIGDPDWKKAYAASIKDGRLVKKVASVYMKPTDYSPIK